MKPIIFSTPMVQAILEGRKSMARRICKRQDLQSCPNPECQNRGGYPVQTSCWTYVTRDMALDACDPSLEGSLYSDDEWELEQCQFCWEMSRSVFNYLRHQCPYEVGNQLWVRETFADLRGMGFDYDFAYKADSCKANGIEDSDLERYRKDYDVKWKPSIHMPREAARIFLEITNIRVERVQDIDCNDADAEGVECKICRNTGYKVLNEKSQIECHCDTADLFRKLWDSINKQRGYGWFENPWVWVIEFKRIHQLKEEYAKCMS